MLKLYYEIFSKDWLEVFEKLSRVPIKAILGGGSAVCLHLGHRKSYDLDLFLGKPIEKKIIFSINKIFPKERIKILEDTSDELSFLTENNIKVTYFYFPFENLYNPIKTKFIPIFHKRDLVSNKMYSIGRRGVWRDYVDLFFLIKSGITLKNIISDTKKRFKGNFNEKLFLEQLVYFEDIKDFTIEYTDKKFTPSRICSFLKKEVVDYVK